MEKGIRQSFINDAERLSLSFIRGYKSLDLNPAQACLYYSSRKLIRFFVFSVSVAESLAIQSGLPWFVGLRPYKIISESQDFWYLGRKFLHHCPVGRSMKVTPSEQTQEKTKAPTSPVGGAAINLVAASKPLSSR
jgi:hypothetical protein